MPPFYMVFPRYVPEPRDVSSTEICGSNDFGKSVIILFFYDVSLNSQQEQKGFVKLQVDPRTAHQPTSSNSSRPSAKRLSWFRSHFPAKTTVELIQEGSVR